LQLNYSYTLLLVAHFQGFCRDLHTEVATYLANWLTASSFQGSLQVLFLSNRKLDTGNPNPGNLGADFNRFGLDFWGEVTALSTRNSLRQQRLMDLNNWRNAIAHHDFSRVGRRSLRLATVRQWRSACDRLALSFDRVLFSYLQRETAAAPW
jgi:HEPN superfamily RiboL-PSP-like protein